MATRNNQSGWLVECQGEQHGSFELLATCPAPPRGLIHFSHDSSSSFCAPEIWREVARIRASAFPGPFLGAALILSNYGNLEIVVVQKDGAVAHFWKNGIFGWSGPTFLPGKAAGVPAFVQSGFGRCGNFEVIAPSPGGGLRHFWRDNDGSVLWHRAPPPQGDGNWSGVGLIYSNFGHLEVVGVRDERLTFLWQDGPAGVWRREEIDPARAVKGRPAFIQSTYGVRGNFEVVGLTDVGGLVHYWRNNDAAGFPWSAGTLLPPVPNAPPLHFDDVTMIQSSYGRLEVVARDASRSAILHYREGLGLHWEGPISGPAMTCDGTTFI